MSTGKVVLGTLAGLAIGAAAGILLAPEKGSVTRKQIMDKGGSYLDGLKSKFDRVKDSLTEKLESAKKDAENFVDKSKEKFNDARKDAKNTASNYNQDSPSNMNHASSNNRQ